MKKVKLLLVVSLFIFTSCGKSLSTQELRDNLNEFKRKNSTPKQETPHSSEGSVQDKDHTL